MRSRIILLLSCCALAVVGQLKVSTSVLAQTAQAASVSATGAPAPLPVRMLEHAVTLLQHGNVRGAREFLEISASDGLADAAITLSLTYDREALRARGLPIDLADDAARARWAQHAIALGYQSAGGLAPALPIVIASSKAAIAATATVVHEPSSKNGTTEFDGTYSSQALPACGEPLQSVFLKINRGTVAFEHVVKGVPYDWRGTIDADGAITASVAGAVTLQAAGRFDEKTINLTYPQCGPTPIVLRIRWLVR